MVIKRLTKTGTMAAIVLTCDEYRPFTENMIRSYEQLWPSHPFNFFIPFQAISSLSASVPETKVTMVKAGKPIKDTMLALLEPFEDHEFVYWCIDDKFLVAANPKKLEVILEPFLNQTMKNSSLNGLAFTRARGLLGPPNLHSTPQHFLNWQVFKRANLNGIWFHQILRVGVLRDFYTRIPHLVEAKDYDHWKKQSYVPDNLFVTEETLISLAESTHRGKATALALKAMRRRNILPLPEHVSRNPPRFRRVGFVGGTLSKLVVSVGFSLRRIREKVRHLSVRRPEAKRP